MELKMKFRKYTGMGDFYKIRDFLVESYSVYQRPYNWTMERWNYTRYRTSIIYQTPVSEWENSIGIWESENGEIAAVVHSEGEGRGEAFFEINPNIDNIPYEELFSYAEENLLYRKNDKKNITLWIPDDNKLCVTTAESKGYKKPEEKAITSEYNIKENGIPEVPLPKGFSISSMAENKDLKKRSDILSWAFNSIGKHWQGTEQTFARFQDAPDYRKDLDIVVLAPSGLMTACCTVWYDSINKIGILEPVGTHPDHRRRGFAKAAIMEGLRRIKKEGAEKCYVGSDQKFYLDIGFQPKHVAHIWEKEL